MSCRHAPASVSHPIAFDVSVLEHALPFLALGQPGLNIAMPGKKPFRISSKLVEKAVLLDSVNAHEMNVNRFVQEIENNDATANYKSWKGINSLVDKKKHEVNVLLKKQNQLQRSLNVHIDPAQPEEIQWGGIQAILGAVHNKVKKIYEDINTISLRYKALDGLLERVIPMGDDTSTPDETFESITDEIERILNLCDSSDLRYGLAFNQALIEFLKVVSENLKYLRPGERWFKQNFESSIREAIENRTIFDKAIFTDLQAHTHGINGTNHEPRPDILLIPTMERIYKTLESAIYRLQNIGFSQNTIDDYQEHSDYQSRSTHYLEITLPNPIGDAIITVSFPPSHKGGSTWSLAFKNADILQLCKDVRIFPSNTTLIQNRTFFHCVNHTRKVKVMRMRCVRAGFD